MGKKSETRLNPPQQVRSQETLKKLLEATEEILSAEPAIPFSLRKVLERSGVSNGAFYARFPDRESLLEECWKSLVDSVDEKVNRNFDQFVDQPLAVKVRKLITWQVERFRRYRGVFRAYSTLLRTENLKPAKKSLKRYSQSTARTIEFLMASSSEIAHNDPKRAIAVAEFVTFAAAREMILFPNSPHATTMKMSKAKLIEELTNVFLACLCFDTSSQLE